MTLRRVNDNLTLEADESISYQTGEILTGADSTKGGFLGCQNGELFSSYYISTPHLSIACREGGEDIDDVGDVIPPLPQQFRDNPHNIMWLDPSEFGSKNYIKVGEDTWEIL
jgi:hypothetical protein